MIDGQSIIAHYLNGTQKVTRQQVLEALDGVAKYGDHNTIFEIFATTFPAFVL